MAYCEGIECKKDQFNEVKKLVEDFGGYISYAWPSNDTYSIAAVFREKEQAELFILSLKLEDCGKHV